MRNLEAIKIKAYENKLVYFRKLQEIKIEQDAKKPNPYLQEYNEKIAKQHREKRNKYQKNRANKDIKFKIRKILSNRVYQALKGKNKSASTMKLIGCSIEQLKNHIESQFKKRMNWDNYGTGANGKGMKEWHLDHIKPCASFDLSKPEEQQKCFHYSNLQPLWAKENLEKKDIYFPPN